MPAKLRGLNTEEDRRDPGAGADAATVSTANCIVSGVCSTSSSSDSSESSPAIRIDTTKLTTALKRLQVQLRQVMEASRGSREQY